MPPAAIVWMPNEGHRIRGLRVDSFLRAFSKWRPNFSVCPQRAQRGSGTGAPWDRTSGHAAMGCIGTGGACEILVRAALAAYALRVCTVPARAEERSGGSRS
jgi:hypothetical protein